MLPYTPLHHLLLENLDRPLVMTSGNISDEPICHEDIDALTRLSRIADYFLLHDRRIHIRTDDSVARAQAVTKTDPAPLARLRAGADQDLVQIRAGDSGLRRGAQEHFLSARAAITPSSAITSATWKTWRRFARFSAGIEHFKRLFNLRPEVIAYDLHPEYLSTKYALALDDEMAKVGVQHHHAHIASCMADNGIEGEVIGVAMDGLGSARTGVCGAASFSSPISRDAERVAHLEYVPMPGGAKAIREPWRMAAVYLQRAFGDDFRSESRFRETAGSARLGDAAQDGGTSGINSPETSSMGRLFDAVASLVGVTRLLRVMKARRRSSLRWSRTKARWAVTSSNLFRQDHQAVAGDSRRVEDLLRRVPTAGVAAKFHNAVAGLIFQIARRIRDERGLNRVALSGGVFQNVCC